MGFQKIAFELDIEKAKADPNGYGRDMLVYGILGSEHGDVYDMVIDSIDTPDDAYLVLQLDRLERNDPKRDALLAIAIAEPKYAFSLLATRKLLPGDAEFEDAVRSVATDASLSRELYHLDRVHSSDVPRDVWRTFLESMYIYEDMEKGGGLTFQRMLDNWEATTHAMDKEIMEEMDRETDFSTDAQFLTEYLRRHFAKYGQDFILN